MAKKPVKTPVRDLSKQAEKMGFPKSSMTPLYLGTTGTDHRPAVTYTQLSDTEGYPRGYNPEQMQQVRNAEDQGKISITQDRKSQQVDPMAEFFGGFRGRGFIKRSHPEREKATIRETIARSRFNPETLPDKGTLEIRSTENLTSQNPNAFGSFIRIRNPDGYGVTGDRLITVLPNQLHTSTLIHELGHDVFHHDKENGIYKYFDLEEKYLHRLPEEKGDKLAPHLESGTHEGYANKFSDENFVLDPRDVRKGINTNPGNSYGLLGLAGPQKQNKGRTWAFGVGYRGIGGPVPSRDSEEVQAAFSRMATNGGSLSLWNDKYKITADELDQGLLKEEENQ